LAASLRLNSPDIVSTRQILVRPLGHVNRVGGNEVQEISGSVFNAAGEELIYIDINREGLYDGLPEMLFIQPDTHYEDAVEKARHLAQQTENARRFLLPFEESLYQARIDLEIAERTTLSDLSGVLLKIYGLDEPGTAADNAAQMLSLALVMPLLHQVVGDLAATGNLLTTLVRQPVKLEPAQPLPYAIPDDQQSRLGAGLLGVDLLLGNLFQDGIRTLALTIGEVPPAQLEDWLPGGLKRRFLEDQLLPQIIPAGELVQIQVEITPAAGSFRLGNTNEVGLNILGYTSLSI
jgi:hypothetical protein